MRAELGQWRGQVGSTLLLIRGAWHAGAYSPQDVCPSQVINFGEVLFLDWTSVRALWSRLELQGLVVAAVITIGWLWVIGRCLRADTTPRQQWGLGAGLAAAAAAFVPSIVLVQVPCQTAVSRWVMSSLSTANQLITAIPAIALSGLIQEAVKAVFALACWRVARSAGNSSASAVGGLFGAWVGAGYGGMEAWVILSGLFRAPGTTARMVAAAVAERLPVVAVHAALPALVLGHWAKSGPAGGMAALLVVAFWHGLINYGVVLARTGVLGLTSTYLYVYLTCLLPLAYLLVRARRERT